MPGSWLKKQVKNKRVKSFIIYWGCVSKRLKLEKGPTPSVASLPMKCISSPGSGGSVQTWGKSLWHFYGPHIGKSAIGYWQWGKLSSRISPLPHKKALAEAPKEDLSQRLQINKPRNIGTQARNADKRKSMWGGGMSPWLQPYRDSSGLAMQHVCCGGGSSFL